MKTSPISFAPVPVQGLKQALRPLAQTPVLFGESDYTDKNKLTLKTKPSILGERLSKLRLPIAIILFLFALGFNLPGKDLRNLQSSLAQVESPWEKDEAYFQALLDHPQNGSITMFVLGEVPKIEDKYNKLNILAHILGSEGWDADLSKLEAVFNSIGDETLRNLSLSFIESYKNEPQAEVTAMRRQLIEEIILTSKIEFIKSTLNF